MLKKKHLLVIDDETAVLEFVRLLLERADFTIDVEANSLSALERFDSDPDRYDAVITDNFMPDMSGFDLAKAIRELRPEVPIILISGFCPPAQSRELEPSLFFEYIKKPFTCSAIVAAVKRAIEQPESGEPPSRCEVPVENPCPEV